MSNHNIRVDAIGLAAEVVELRNEIARLKGQTNWVCKCGGTDCEGQRENAALREDKERLDWLARNRSVSSSERPLGVTPESLRASIDAARKEAQS